MCHWPRIPFRHVMGLAVLLLAAAAPAMVLRVPGEAPDLATALGFAQSGDTLLLRPGRHRAVDLHLADGITVLGEGPGVVLKGNHHRPLLNIRGAHQGVVLENLELTGGRSRRDGGALRITDSRVRLTGLTIRGCRARHAGGALFALDSHLELRDCIFLDNRADDGGTIALAARDTNAVTGQLLVDNALFAGNRARTGGAISTEVPASVTHGTFVGNEVEGADADGSAIRARSSLELLMCNLVGNRGGSPGAGPVALSKDDTLRVSYTNIHGNIGGGGTGDPVASRTGRGNLSVSPGLVDAVKGDFRLRWDSPLLDKGDPDAPLDFDLTRADIGWQPTYPVAALSSVASGTVLPVGHYEVIENCTIHGEITPGSVIRLAGGKNLSIAGADSSGVRKIGDQSQPRTAIVGRSSRNSEPAGKIFFVNQSGNQARLEFEGVLLNYPPLDATYGASVFFHGWQPAQGNGITLTGNSIDFMNYLEVPRQGGDPYDGGLMFNLCTGYIDGIQFGDTLQSNPAYLALNSSRVDVLNCTFKPGQASNTADNPSLKIHSTLTGPECQVHDNTFFGVGDSLTYMLDLSWAVVDLERNRFLDAQNTLLILTSSTTHADHEARNHVEGAEGFTQYQPLVVMEGGFLDLYCGRNNFVRPQASLLNPFIYWEPDSIIIPPIMTEWRENFWGGSCQEQVFDNVLNAPGATYLPPWTYVENSLEECLEPTDPSNPFCPLEISTPAGLLKDGTLAEIGGDFGTAHLNYAAVLMLYSRSKEANEATLRLKALGLHKTYGDENYTSVRDDLFQAQDSSIAELMKRQAVLQGCSGWCVEARWGDRPAALDTLNVWYAKEKDPLNKDTIKLALLEIATYPVQGQMSSAGPEAQMTLAIVQQEAVNTLLNFKRGQGSDEEATSVLPQTFQISNLYPNPFNARTTIVLQVPKEGKVQVEVYNLLGQLVGTLHSGTLTAGEHRLVANGERWASGLYFVTAESASKVQVRKMLLVK